jgi:pyrroloquinoline quinone (PQQ) biosynthesis protein C
MKFVLRMMETADLQRGALETLPFLERMLAGHGTRDDYRRFLFDLYHVVLHFAPITASAVSRCLGRYDDVRAHLYESIANEKGHENLVAEDLEELLGEPGHPELHQPSPPVRAIIGSNYYQVDRGHPCAVLGLLYVLEFIASCYAGTLADCIAESMPESAASCRFLVLHASRDQHHVAQLHDLLEKIPDQQAQQAIVASTELNFYLFRVWIDHLGRSNA